MTNFYILKLASRKGFEHNLIRWWIKYIIQCKIFSLWIVGVADSAGSCFEIVLRMAELNIGPEQEPVSTCLSEWHSHAAGVYDAHFPNDSVELHMGMAADDDGFIESAKHWQQASFGRPTSEALDVAPGGCVAEHHPSEPRDLGTECFRPAGNLTSNLEGELLRRPLYSIAGLFWERAQDLTSQMVEYGDLAIPMNKIDWYVDTIEQLKSFGWHRAWNHVATNDDSVWPNMANLIDNSLESRQIPVDVVEGGDSDGSKSSSG